MIHLNTSHDGEMSGVHVNCNPGTVNPEYAVQMFLGDAYHTLYMSIEDARAFAQRILAVTEEVSDGVAEEVAV